MRNLIIIGLLLTCIILNAQTGSNPFDFVSEQEKEEYKGLSKIEIWHKKKNEMIVLNCGFGMGFLKNDFEKTTNSEINQFNSDLTQGINISASLMYYTKLNIGFGAAGDFYKSRAVLKNILIEDDNGNSLGTANYSEEYSIPSFGLVMGYKKAFSQNRLIFGSDLRLYIALFSDERSFSNFSDFPDEPSISSKYTGNTFCPYTSFFAEYFLKKEISIGLNVSGIIGEISELSSEGTTLTLSEPISLNRLNIMLGLRFYWLR